MKMRVKDINVLITGGTSGLGKSLANRFLENGSKVFAVGRRENGLISNDNCINLLCDFSQLSQVRKLATEVSEKKIDILVCNAGILSPQNYHQTTDGFEKSFQVNFLAHVLLIKLLMKNERFRPKVLANTSSPIYWYGRLDVNKICNEQSYGFFQAYANSKLFMALLSERLAKEGLPSFSFNPGTFSSGIYREQQQWFHRMYKLAAPLMAPVDQVADGLFQGLLSQSWSNGEMMNKKGKVQTLKKYSSEKKEVFWAWIDQQLEPFMN